MTIRQLAAEQLARTVDARRAAEACLTCDAELPESRCAASRRPCGHHCNHSWNQDECCWCGVVFGENGVEIPPAGESGDGRELREWTLARGLSRKTRTVMPTYEVVGDIAAIALAGRPDDFEIVRVREIPSEEEGHCERCEDVYTVACEGCVKERCCGVGAECPACFPAGNWPGSGPLPSEETGA